MQSNCTSYLAQDCIKTNEQQLDGNERINVHVMALDEFLDLVKSGDIDVFFSGGCDWEIYFLPTINFFLLWAFDRNTLQSMLESILGVYLHVVFLCYSSYL